MKYTIALGLLSVVAALNIQTPPSLITCQPAAITFGDGQPPYYVNVLPAGQASATPLEQFGAQQTSPYTWNVDLPAGTNVSFSVVDGSGSPAYSSWAVIQAGPQTSCVKGGSGGTTASGSAASGSASGSAAAAGGASATTSSGSSAAPSASKSGAAVAGQEVGHLVGVLGVVAALGAIL